MPHADSSPPPRIGLQELVALNQEIAALVRAGLPLELGLGAGATGRLSHLTDQLGDDLRAGQSLPDAIATRRSGLPRVYSAVIESGLRSGRLPEALETLVELGESLLLIRRRIGVALLYPAIVIVVAWMLSLLYLPRFTFAITSTAEVFRMPQTWWLSALQGVTTAVTSWGFVVPLAVVALTVWWFVAGRFLRPVSGLGGIGFEWIPGLRRILANHHRAVFAELAALQLGQDVPLPVALPLAAEATGDTRLISQARRIASDVSAGSSLETALETTAIPAFLRWMLLSGMRQNTPEATLRQAATFYRRRAEYQAAWFQLILPIAVTVLLGGTLVLFYALTLFIPFTGMLESLGS